MAEPRTHAARAALALAALLLAAPAAGLERLAGPGMLLPVQDRVGDPALTTVIHDTFEAELAESHQLVRTPEMRDVLRRLRIRDVKLAAPAQLDRLASELGVEWFLSSTLHEAILDPVPQITVSARLYRAGVPELAWAGFDAASGIDEQRWLGLGGTADAFELARQVALRLAESALGRAGEGRRARDSDSKNGFRSRRLEASPTTLAAIVPFDSVSGPNSGVAAEIVTEATIAALYELGIRLLSPSAVDEIQRERGRLWRGELDAPTRQALNRQGGVDWVLTGTVEVYVSERSLRPDPRVALSARLLEAASGRILWMDGRDRRGARPGSLYDTGRIYSAGALANEIVRAFVAELYGPQDRQLGTSEG